MPMASIDLVQHALVSLVALGAAGVLFRRLSGIGRPASTPGCSNCPSGGKTRRAAADPRADAPPAEHPLVFIRSPRR
jgi:hypothetical protein